MRPRPDRAHGPARVPSRRWSRSVCSVTARRYSWKTMCWAGVGQTTSLSQRRCAGPHVARPVDRISCRSRKALRRNVAVLRSGSVSSRARRRSRIAASWTAGTETGVRSPERIRRANWMASRRSVWTQSPVFFGIKEGATTHQPYQVVLMCRKLTRRPLGVNLPPLAALCLGASAHPSQTW